MTEEQWLKADELHSMLNYLNHAIGERKFRLTECAFLRRFWHLYSDERNRSAVELAELYADGLASRDELRLAYADAAAAFGEILEACPAARMSNGIGGFYGGAVSAAQHTASSHYDTPELLAHRENSEGFRQLGNLVWISTAACPVGGVVSPSIGMAAIELEQKVHASILHELFGNPFRRITIDPAWLTPTVLTLAQAAYEERILPSGELDPARLAVLSDALEEAGCDNADILNHLRSPGPHVRGCWALDLILGKE